MAPPANAKIEELRFRLKTDPRSRLFFPLAEELRKNGQAAEAEQVLRTGLVAHPTYLSAWVSLGRVLREQKKDADSIEALTRALQLDPGNVVAARLLADTHLGLGDKIEAIKKYKLVHALMPGDSEVEGIVASLDAELNPPAAIEVAPPPPPPPPPPKEEEESLFDQTMPPFAESSTRDVEPMHVAHEESPFEEPLSDYTAAALTVEAPVGMHIEEAPPAAEVPAPVTAPEPPAEDVTSTITMADLYARQGLTDDARQIYETILARDPENHDVRAKLDELSGGQAILPLLEEDGQAGSPVLQQSAHAKVARLEGWLSKVSRKEVRDV